VPASLGAQAQLSQPSRQELASPLQTQSCQPQPSQQVWSPRVFRSLPQQEEWNPWGQLVSKLQAQQAYWPQAQESRSKAQEPVYQVLVSQAQ